MCSWSSSISLLYNTPLKYTSIGLFYWCWTFRLFKSYVVSATSYMSFGAYVHVFYFDIYLVVEFVDDKLCIKSLLHINVKVSLSDCISLYSYQEWGFPLLHIQANIKCSYSWWMSSGISLWSSFCIFKWLKKLNTISWAISHLNIFWEVSVQVY